jgi:hypothetical protein
MPSSGGAKPCPRPLWWNWRGQVSGPPTHADRSGQPCPTCSGQQPPNPRGPSPTEQYNAAEKGGAAGEPKAVAQVCCVCGGPARHFTGGKWWCNRCGL